MRSFVAWLRNPWARPRFLWAVAIAYMVWTLLPVAIAVLFSFNSTRALSAWQGFSLRWYTGDPDASVLHDAALQHAVLQTLKLSLLTALVAVPLGVLFAIGLHRWRGATAKTANFVMLFSFVTPELILAVALFLLFVHAFEVTSALSAVCAVLAAIFAATLLRNAGQRR